MKWLRIAYKGKHSYLNKSEKAETLLWLIEFLGITFTEQANFVAESGETEMFNNSFANTFVGNDLIVGNSGALNTDNGNA